MLKLFLSFTINFVAKNCSKIIRLIVRFWSKLIVVRFLVNFEQFGYLSVNPISDPFGTKNGFFLPQSRVDSRRSEAKSTRNGKRNLVGSTSLVWLGRSSPEQRRPFFRNMQGVKKEEKSD